MKDNERRLINRAAMYARDKDLRLRSITRSAGFARVLASLREQCARGDGEAMATLGWLHDMGVGVPRDVAVAQRLYEQAALRGNPYGQRETGNGYLFGVGRRKDEKQGLKWLLKAAGNGDSWAKLVVGWRSITGAGLRKNIEKGSKLLLESARSGVPEAELYAAFYYDFKARPARPDRAAHWYRRAARHGNAVAMFNLGMAYEKGVGVRRNVGVALRWLRRAEEAGESDAREEIQRVARSFGKIG